MEINIVKPMEIEKKSFEIIEDNIKNKVFKEENKDIIKRVIHTTADFDYADNLIFSDAAVEIALKALNNKANIVTDTQMAFSGINKKVLEKLDCNIHCYISDADVAQEAKKREITRAMVSMEKACNLGNNTIFVIGNAPTALIKLDELIKTNKISPALIIGVPVGFVNVVESKELIISGNTPYIVAKGNKGGSNVAAAIMNALIYKIIR